MSPNLHRTCCTLALLLALTACDQKAADPSAQYGANPKLPPPEQYILPPMRIAVAAGWGKDKMPVVAAGLQVKAFATDFRHPRVVYPLPNGDVLVVETNGPKAPVYRPKDFIEGTIKGLAGSGAPAGNRIILLRDADGDGVPETRTVFIDHLNSPFGVVLVGNDLYVADTDAILKFSYVPGETRIATAGEKLTDLPAGPINHH
jgi:glucose/arabinose dehydrogenase